MASSPLPARYDQLSRLGEGAFGVVYRARDTRLQRMVAAKVLKAALGDAEMSAFLGEARAQAALSHPNIVTVFDIGRTETDAFITMEFATEGTVADGLMRGAYPPARVTQIITDAATGLDHAHQHGLIHRDIKPANLLVADGGRVMVADFGLAREIGRETTHFAGTIVYMAPEQMNVGKGFTPATDVFALAVTAYELLTGRHHGGFPAISTGNNPPAVHRVLEGIDPAVDAVLAAALEPDPRDRTATPGAFAAALADTLEERRRAPAAARADYTALEPAPPVVHKAVSESIRVGGLTTTELTCIGVEWSGSAKEKDAGKSIWTAIVRGGVLESLVTGRGRRATADALIAEAASGRPTVVGMDFAFSLPGWYLDLQNWESAFALWEVLARMENEQGAESQWPRSLPAPFWGPNVRLKPELNGGETWFRRTEDETREYTQAHPKSVFQITGAGSVGGQSMRGMPVLRMLRDNGFSVWPMDPPSPQMIVEVYPRALLQWLRPGVEGVAGDEARAAFLEDAPEAFWGNDPGLRTVLESNGSAFDAAVAAWALWVGRDALTHLPVDAGEPFRREGRIWLPPPESTLRPDARPHLREGVSHPSASGGLPSASNPPADPDQEGGEPRIANPHFGNLGDVFKHLLLAEIAREIEPDAYLEAHSGAPMYPLGKMRRGPGDALQFIDFAKSSAILTSSAYAALVQRFAEEGTYLGSAGLVAAVLGAGTSYTLFDEHADTVARLNAMLRDVGLQGQAVERDGLSGVLEAAGPGSLTLIDPFRISAKGEGGATSADVFSILARADDRTAVLWYPVVVPKMKQVWPDRISLDVPEPIWRAEIRLPPSAPGLNGCGVLVSGIDDELADRLGQLVYALGAALIGAFPGTAVGHGWDTDDEAPFTPWTPYGVYREEAA